MRYSKASIFSISLMMTWVWSPASAVVIDSFNYGSVALIAPGGGQYDGAGIVGGERDIETASFVNGNVLIDVFDSNQLAITSFSGKSNLGLYNFVYDGNDSLPSNDFDGLGSVDFTDGGASNALRFRVLSSSAPLRIRVNFSKTVANAPTPAEQYAGAKGVIDIGPITTATDVYIPYASLANPSNIFTDPIDFTDIDWFRWSVNELTNSGFATTIDFVDTAYYSPTQTPEDPVDIPTPGTLSLALAGILAARLGIGRRR